MAFDKLDNLVKNRMKQRGFGRQIDAMDVIKITKEFFDTKFPSFTHKINPVSFKNETLTVACLSAPIASELRVYETDIIKNINQKIGKNLILRIKILL